MMAHPPVHRSRRRPAAATAKAVLGQRRPGKGVVSSSCSSPCVHWAEVGWRVRILARAGELPASAPGGVESMTLPVYPPDLRFDSTGAGGWVCPVGAPMAKEHPPGGEGLSHSPADGGNHPSKATCLSSVVNSWQQGPFSPTGYVQRSEDRLYEPRSPRLDHRRKHPIRGPGRVGLRDLPGGSPGRLRNSRGLKSLPGRTDFQEVLPI